MRYQLPAATSFWQLRLAEEVHDTVWVERSAPVDKPAVMLTIGTMPNSRHAVRELSLAWYPFLIESVHPTLSESEGEGRSEESESQIKQETDVAEESEEEEPCEESESQTGQETDAAIVGCLWVDVMSGKLEASSGWTPESGFACPGWIHMLEVARQQRTCPAFADIWNYIMTAEGTDKLPGIESVCREQAAKRQPLVAHTDVGLLGPRIGLP